MMSRILLAIFGAAVTLAVNTDHQDALIELKENGDLVGLPEEYYPAKFNVDSGYLRIADNEVRLPDCLMDLIDVECIDSLTVTASWYHSEESMPYYLGISRNMASGINEGSVLIELETLKLIWTRGGGVNPQGENYAWPPGVSELCQKRHNSSIINY